MKVHLSYLDYVPCSSARIARANLQMINFLLEFNPFMSFHHPRPSNLEARCKPCKRITWLPNWNLPTQESQPLSCFVRCIIEASYQMHFKP